MSQLIYNKVISYICIISVPLYSEGVGAEGPGAKEKFDLNLVSKNKIHQHIHVQPYSEGVGAEGPGAKVNFELK